MFSILDWFGVSREISGWVADPLGESIRSLLLEADSIKPLKRLVASVNRCSYPNHQRRKGEPDMARYAIPRVAHCCNGSE